MHFDILTLFPDMFTGPLTESILKRAAQAGRISIRLHDIREHATDRHRTADDAPYGGGAGMVMKAEPLAAAIRSVTPREDNDTASDEALDNHLVTPSPGHLVILLTPAGELFDQRIAQELAGYERLVLVCGHYEGVDERVREALIDRELSIGDYVLTGGELAAMVLVDAVARLVPGVIDAEFDRRRVAQRRAAGVPALHPPRRLGGPRGARGAALGPPRAGGTVAPSAAASPHPGAPTRPPGASRAYARRS